MSKIFEGMEEAKKLSAQDRLERRAAKHGLGKPNKAAEEYLKNLMDIYGAKDAEDLKKKMSETELSESTQARLDQFLERIFNKKAYDQALRYYLDMRKKNPGKAYQNLRKAAQATGANIRVLDRVLRLKVKNGELPKHLVNYPSFDVTESQWASTSGGTASQSGWRWYKPKVSGQHEGKES